MCPTAYPMMDDIPALSQGYVRDAAHTGYDAERELAGLRTWDWQLQS